jgi:hypothetical protein
MAIFRDSIYRLQCDRCRRPFATNKGGVCTVCRDILCNAHLHGSLARRLKIELFGGQPVCTKCRAEGKG